MRIGKVIGIVTPGKIHPALKGGQLKIVIPLTFNDLVDDDTIYVKNDYSASTVERSFHDKILKSQGTELVVYDELSAGTGEWIAFSEGAEAAMPFYPDMKPIDAYAAAIIDSLEIDQESVRELCDHKIDKQLILKEQKK